MPAKKFLEILGLKAERPSLDFLQRLVQAHLRNIPWENISKLLRKKSLVLTLPSFSEYVEGAANSRFGGTCHAQNSHFTTLLQHLGFEARLISAVPERLPSHVAIRAKLGTQNYGIDLGLMSSFAGVFLLDPERAFEKTIGDLCFNFKPQSDGENWHLDIYRAGKISRSYKTTSAALDPAAHAEAVEASCEDSAYFMKILAVYRHLGETDVGIWNNRLYFIRGTQREVRKLDSTRELAKAFSEFLFLPKYPVSDAVAILAANGVDIFSKEDIC